MFFLCVTFWLRVPPIERLRRKLYVLFTLFSYMATLNRTMKLSQIGKRFEAIIEGVNQKKLSNGILTRCTEKYSEF